jgi:hypothetical protein
MEIATRLLGLYDANLSQVAAQCLTFAIKELAAILL